MSSIADISDFWTKFVSMVSNAQEDAEDLVSDLIEHFDAHEDKLTKEHPLVNPIRLVLQCKVRMGEDEIRNVINRLLTDDPIIRNNRVKLWIISTPKKRFSNVVGHGFCKSFTLGVVLFDLAKDHFQSFCHRAKYLADVINTMVNMEISEGAGIHTWMEDVFKWIMIQDGARLFTRASFVSMCEEIRYGVDDDLSIRNENLLRALACLSSCVGISDAIMEHYMKSEDKSTADVNDLDIVRKALTKLIGNYEFACITDTRSFVGTIRESFSKELGVVKACDKRTKRKRDEQEEELRKRICH